jgi:hypothetical protein
MKKSQKEQETKKGSSFIRLSGLNFVINGKEINFFYLVFLGIVIYFIYHSSIKTIENIRLANNGKATRAIVTNKQKVGGKGTIDLTFKYQVNGIEYFNTQINEPYNLGDSIYVIYLESNPHISRTYRFIKNNYETDIIVPN